MSTHNVVAAKRPGFVRRHKVATSLVVVLALLLSVAGGWLLYLNHQLGEVSRFDANLDRPDRPARVPGEATNILIAGVDDGKGADLREMLQSGSWEPGSFRSDAIMVLHLNADRTRAQLISFPRDSWVPIAGHGTDKINAAFAEGGPALLAETIEDYADVHLDNAMVVDFNGFEEVTQIVGGVKVYVPETVHDSKLNKTWTAGTHVVEGADALKYVRQRYGLPNGAFDRERRQAVFLRATLAKLTSGEVIRNPIRITKLAQEISGLVATDTEFTPARIRALALSSRRLRAEHLGLASAPYLGTATIGGLSVVQLDQAGVVELFRAVQRDGFAAYQADHPEVVTPSRVN